MVSRIESLSFDLISPVTLTLNLIALLYLPPMFDCLPPASLDRVLKDE